MSRLAALAFASIPTATAVPVETPNVILVIADDVGRDRIALYSDEYGPSRTPRIDALATEGVVFLNAWANPLCSPTRATIATGRYSFRTGVGEPIGANNGYELSLGETTLPEVLKSAGYTSALLGKWHLTDSSPSALHAQLSGFDAHVGTRGNLPDYFQWVKWTNGVPQATTRYATSETIDDTIRMTRALPEPWFLWVGLHAAHKPFHAPPDELHGMSLSGAPAGSAPDHHRAAVEAIDTEFGRLIDSLDSETRARTTIVFVGDNGSPTESLLPPLKVGKGSLTESGIRVPLIIAGAGVSARGARCDALVNTTDLFATIADLAQIDLTSTVPAGVTLDAVSARAYLHDPARQSLRRWVYAERFPNGAPGNTFRRALRDERFKLVRQKEVGQGGFGPNPGVLEKLFDLRSDPLEGTNLLNGTLNAEQQAAYDNLKQRMSDLLQP